MYGIRLHNGLSDRRIIMQNRIQQKFSFKLTVIFFFMLLLLIFNFKPSYSFFVDFEAGIGKDREVVKDYPGLRFKTTDNFDWLYCDITTGHYNAHSVDLGLTYGSGAYNIYGKVSTWLGPSQGRGIIEFSKKDGTWFRIGYSSATNFYLEAYDEFNNLIASSMGEPNLYTSDMNFLKVDAPPGKTISYVMVHDSGNLWTIDNISGDSLKPNRYAVLWGFNPWVSDFSRWLQKLGWPKENIYSHPEEVFNEEWITKLSEVVKPGDEFIFYYAGHGSVGGNKGENKTGSFKIHEYTIDYAEDELLKLVKERFLYNGPTSIVSDDFLTNLFKNSVWENVKKTFILDSCFSGGFWGGNDIDNSGDLERLKNTRLIAAAEEDGTAYWIKFVNYTYLTYGLLDNALNKKKADKNKDGLITIPELVEYIENNKSKFWGEAYIWGSVDAYEFDFDRVYSDVYQKVAYYSNISMNREIIEFGSYDTQTKQIYIDIKPGSFPNSVNLKSQGVIPVAIVTNSDFDAINVDPDSVVFQNASPLHWAEEDVDNDGDMDLILHFDTQEVSFDSNETAIATLRGTTYDGKPIEGSDNLTIVPR